MHPKARLQPSNKPSMYFNAPMPGQEEFTQFARFGYNVETAKEGGMAMRVAKRLGQLWQPGYQGMLEQAGLQGEICSAYGTLFSSCYTNPAVK